MSARLAFRLAVIAALIMLGVGAWMGVTAPSCRPLPMTAMTAFELARSAGDLLRIFGAPGEACRAPLVAQLDDANVLDAAGYIPAYTAFYALVLFGLGRRDAGLGWAGVSVAIVCAIADWIEDVALFNLSGAPDAPASWLSLLIAFTNVKWVGLAVATTIGGVMLARRGGFGWLGLVACAAPLVSSFWAVISPDAGGQYLVPGMAVASIALLAIAVVGSFAKQAAPIA
jgi:hypothetical protein